MFLHSLHPGAPEKVVIEADWYKPVRLNPVSRLQVIKYERDEHQRRFAFLGDAVAQNCVFWPSKISGQPTTWDVIKKGELPSFPADWWLLRMWVLHVVLRTIQLVISTFC